MGGKKQKTTTVGKWQPAFLEALAREGCVTTAAKAAGIDRAFAYKCRNQDPKFAQSWDEAIEVSIDVLAKIARDRAAQHSDKLLVFLLASYRPSVFGRKQQLDVNGNVTIQTVQNIDEGGLLGGNGNP